MHRKRIFHGSTMLKRRMPDTYVLNTVPEVSNLPCGSECCGDEKEISVTDERQSVSITVEKQDAESRAICNGQCSVFTMQKTFEDGK